jgi:uncharacterized protein (TIGR03032 family)
MGLHYGPGGLWMASLSQLIRFVPIKMPGTRKSSHDFVLVPQSSMHTGYVNAHEIAIDKAGRPLVVGTQFNCVMSVDAARGITPFWAPPFVKDLQAVDLCHLNGICLEEGRLRFATALGNSSEADGWRKHHDRGCVFDCLTGKPVAVGLHRPHSPRLHNGKLWLLNSGMGTIGVVRGRRFVDAVMCPGYPRGLSFLGDAAIIGVSRLRKSGSGLELPLATKLQARKATSRCGVVVLDTASGKPLHEAYFGEGVDEVFDVVALKGIRNPKLIKPGSQEAARSYLFHKHGGNATSRH